MQNEKKYLFVLNDTTFKISFSSCLLLIKKCIYNKLITTQLYKVKSNVSNTVFDSFLKYLTDKETPNINSYNFYEYEELSNEFDIMQPLIQLYQNKIKLTTNIALLLKNQKLNIKLDSISFNFSQKQKNYEKIIQVLFKENQLNTCFKFSPNHHQIYQSCVDSNLKKLENLTKNEIIQNGLSFILDEKEKTSSLYHNIKAVGNIIIPSFIKYKRKKYFVNRIHENAFKKSNGVKSIQFSADCKDILIEKSSLSCESLKKVVLPSNLNHFNAEYFCESENLSEISIDSKNSIFLFYENKFLIGKEEQNNEQYDVLLFASRNLEEVQIPSFIKRIGPYAFESCRKLKRVFFQNDSQLKKIDRFAFFKSNLESISIPSSVKRICEGSFSLCYKLKQFEIKNDSQLKSIGIEAFCESSLESVSIPANIVRISNGAFKKCVNLKRVEFHENSKLKSIGQSAFSNTSIECISIPSHLIQIESNAFAFCYDLSRIDFSNDSELQLIGKRVFYKTKIENIAIPSSVLDIQAGFAMGNSSTINIDPNNNRFLLYQQKFLLSKTDLKNDIYDIILLASSEIKTVKIFPFINKIASYAFANCKNLQNVDFSQNKNLFSIEKYSFNNTSLKNITIPSKIVKIGKNSFSLCASLKKVDFESHSNLVSFENYAFAWSSLIEISFPSSLKKINKYAFYSCYNLKKVQFDNDSKLEKIGKCAFASSGLERMLIPANVIEIGQEAFYGCKFLENLIFYENSRLKIINNRAFSDSTIRCISISQSVTEIWDFVFFNCQKLEIIEFLNIKNLKYFNINYLCMHPNNKNMIIMITN